MFAGGLNVIGEVFQFHMAASHYAVKKNNKIIWEMF